MVMKLGLGNIKEIHPILHIFHIRDKVVVVKRKKEKMGTKQVFSKNLSHYMSSPMELHSTDFAPFLQ